MKKIYLKKTKNENGIEWVNANQVWDQGFSEYDYNFMRHYIFINKLCELLNYFVANRSTAFGNPDYTLLEGFIKGYCCANNWSWYDIDNKVVIKSGKRYVVEAEKPNIPQAEIEAKKSINKLLADFGL